MMNIKFGNRGGCGIADQERECAFSKTNAGESNITEEINAALFERIQKMAKSLAGYCAKMDNPSFNPAFQRN